MPKKFVCTLSTEELKKAYIDEHRTVREMCDYVGIKSTITMAKILNARGISTNANQRLVEKTLNGMTEGEFKAFLEEQYAKGLSMGKIAEMVGITPSGVRKYFVKFGIKRRPKYAVFQSHDTNPGWHGGRNIRSNGYVEIYAPAHPNANVRKYVYEHQLVMEQHIGRPLRPGEVVHHIDGDKTNNDIKNLMLLSNEDHAKLHMYLRKIKKEVTR